VRASVGGQVSEGAVMMTIEEATPPRHQPG